MAYPYKGRFVVSQTFLNKNDIYESGTHLGIDLVGLDEEKRIYPIRSGYVHTISYTDGFGNNVIVKMDNGLYCRYSHLAKVLVMKDQRVYEGVTQIGIEGATGNVRGDDPRHLDLRISKYPYHTNSVFDYYNPTEYLKIPNQYGYIVEDDIMKNLVVANNGIDEKIAWYLSWHLDAPLIHAEDVKQEHIDKANNVFEIGGEKKITKSVHISGVDRYDTARKVMDFISNK